MKHQRIEIHFKKKLTRKWLSWHFCHLHGKSHCDFRLIPTERDTYMGRAVRKGPLGHKLSKMSYCRHVIVQILKNLGVQTVFWNSTPKYPKRGIEKDLFFPKSCMRALTILQHLQSARGPRDRGGQRCFKSFWSFFLEFSPAFFPILWSSTSPCHVVISVINVLWILGFHDNR